MKNIFDVDSYEIKRILSLHEESTKKQYLNVINEIGISGEGEQKISIPNASIKAAPDAIPSYTTIGVNSLENVKIGQAELEFYKGTKFTKKISKSNNPYLVSQTVNVKFKSEYGGQDAKAVKGKILYWCKGSIIGKYQFSAVSPEEKELRKNDLWYDDGDLTQALVRVCKYVSPKPVTEPEIKKGEVKKGMVTKQAVNGQTFSTQNTELTKQIQTSLGNTTPTGQITDTDLDLILTQLKQV